MTEILHAAANGSWPAVVVILGVCALIGFVYWLFMRG